VEFDVSPAANDFTAFCVLKATGDVIKIGFYVVVCYANLALKIVLVAFQMKR